MLKQLGISLAIFLGIDLVWLGVVARRFYDQQLSPFPRSFRLLPAFGSYLLIVLGIITLVLPKAAGNPKQALIWGGVYGLIVYGVYDLVNLATLSDWSIKMTVVDMLWGMVVCAAVSYLVVTFVK